jgi:c-di-GMP-binding flagellar brake protein YcgR
MFERRKYPRIGISFPVECSSLPSGNYFYTVSKDLSNAGVKIVTNNFLPKNKPVRVDINLIDKIISLKARVAWCNERPISDSYLVGLAFIEISKENQSNISRFIKKIN